ncbi:thiamine pyrophosphate-binding protein [Blautia glucerasea]|uniref:thiamine pyrophosphate-binding protein n=1 Tax=Blautia glucerasea TaxID=536633 RepID=UPI001D033913|nr:thiamine pyrophosphate-binding protein [Blautia glucerasea]MCB5388123.1 thiamine pyrophosphate-binding protein [Blautia glucerasea]MCB5422463.1 thiamine pyrophosphate-binding protein [Blautia luti]
MKVTDYIVEFLQRKGIHDFFGYQGTMIAHLVDSIEKNPHTKSHSSYHEQGAAFAACGYAQAGERCACAYATSGPGAANLISGIADAYFDSLPVVFLTGQLNTYEYSGIPGLRQQGFQEIDIVAMAKPVTKYAVQIREDEDIVKALNKAYHIANSGRKGPVLIDLPMNIQRGDVKKPVYDMSLAEMGLDQACESSLDAAANGSEATARTLEVKPGANETIDSVQLADGETSHCTALAADAIRHALAEAQRPVIMLGHGVSDKAVRDQLFTLARQWKLPVITSVLEMSALPWDDPLNFGCIGGAYGHRYANMIANAKSDLLICLGISLCTRQIGTKVHEFAKNAKIIRVDIDQYNLQRNIHENGMGEMKFCADAAEVIRLLAESAENAKCARDFAKKYDNPAIYDFSDWLAVCKDIRTSLRAVDDATPERYPNRMIAALSDALTDTAAVAVDVGQHMVWSYQSFHNQKDQKLLFSGGHGAMGYALPAAIGAYYATGKPVACICGDGAFQMNIQELEWVRRENLPITMMVMNNHALGMIRHLQRDYFGQVYADTSEGSGFSSCSFAEVAKAYGISSVCMEAGQAAEKASTFLQGTQAPKLLEIRMEPGTFAYPKTCLGEPIHNQQPYIPKDVYERLLNL